MPENVIIAPESPFTPEAQALIAQLDADLLTRYSADNIHGADFHALLRDGGTFFIARIENHAVGCAALRVLNAQTGELKRVYVALSARRRSVARALVLSVEAAARERGLGALRLETGLEQPEAIALYESMNYSHIAPFGHYADDPRSVCMEKSL